ncbi:aminotransferase class III-fold pyridoxal phosphate-dependent enzyme [Candidatus Pelagibacter sp.]|nr:aminotransferase class III-fold pyridoxal phosphate-dependent enzyme [Candidatus Pelagibacter sp.]
MISKKPKINESNKLYSIAENIIPSGGQTYSKGVTQFTDGIAPKYLESGKGAYATDVDGNKYIDYVLACQPLILGYADPDVNKAITKQLEKGSTFSLHNKLEIDVAKMLIELVPSAEMVRFGKNGADATTIAIRLARAYTERDEIAFCGYHGWHDWFIATTDLNDGIPKFNNDLIHKFNYNDIESLKKIFKKRKNKIAAVMMEPLAVAEPKCYGSKDCQKKICKEFCQNNFLHEVKKIAKQNGAVLIFDEVVTGFRFSLGGAQELTGVTPDLTALAKAMSNGVPISAIVGKKRIMKLLDKTFFSFTYGGDCIGLSAAKATIEKIQKKNVIRHIYKMGEHLKFGINSLSKKYGLQDIIKCVGYPCRSILSINGNQKFNDLEIKTFIQQELFKRGILWAAYHTISWSHKKKEIEKTLNAFSDVFDIFQRKFIKGNLKIKNSLEGRMLKPVFRQVADFNSYITKKK